MPDVHADAEGRYLMSWSDYEAGDYWKLVSASGGKIEWYIKDPSGQLGSIANHTVVENGDGTITVSPSILAHGPNPYHGFLVAGNWSGGIDTTAGARYTGSGGRLPDHGRGGASLCAPA
jgi:hypothetical protein